MLWFGASSIIDSKVGGGEGVLSEMPLRVVFFLFLLSEIISFEVIVSGCRSWKWTTSCPFQLWQP